MTKRTIASFTATMRRIEAGALADSFDENGCDYHGDQNCRDIKIGSGRKETSFFGIEIKGRAAERERYLNADALQKILESARTSRARPSMILRHIREPDPTR